MSKKLKVALIGWNPDVVDYSKWKGLNAELVRAGLEKDKDNLNSEGFDAELIYINDENTAVDKISEVLKNIKYDIIMIGAGVRADNDYFLLFEKLVNVIHNLAPDAKICFNTGPNDTADAIKRWS